MKRTRHKHIHHTNERTHLVLARQRGATGRCCHVRRDATGVRTLDGESRRPSKHRARSVVITQPPWRHSSITVSVTPRYELERRGSRVLGGGATGAFG